MIDYKQALAKAVELLDKQRNRVMFRMDDQLKTQEEVKQFIERWK